MAWSVSFFHNRNSSNGDLLNFASGLDVLLEKLVTSRSSHVACNSILRAVHVPSLKTYLTVFLKIMLYTAHELGFYTYVCQMNVAISQRHIIFSENKATCFG
jgi:hypothetical protein